MAKASKKAPAKKPKKVKMKNNFFWGFNIKLISNERSGEDAYFDMIHKMFTADIRKPIGNDKAATMRNQVSKSYAFNDVEHRVLHGKLTRYTLLDGTQWYNEVTKEYEDPKLQKGIYPNGFETDYIFIPAVHKFFVANNSKVTRNMVHAFLEEALKEVIDSKEDFTLNVMQSQDTIEQIINAPQLRDLYVDVTVTNDDAGDKAQEAIDKMLKKNNIRKFEANIKPDISGALNGKEEFIRGLLELAKDNGEAVAHVVNEDGKKVKIVTSDFPEKFNIKTAENDDIITNIFGTIMGRYKNESAAD